MRYWREVYQGAESEYVRDVAWRHVHDLKIEVDLETLDEAIDRYREARGSYPINLGSLVRAGLIDRVAEDPDGNPYHYDNHSGEVSSQAPFKLRRRAGE